MTSEATIEAVSGPIVQPGANSGTSASLSLRQSAALEFHASLAVPLSRDEKVVGFFELALGACPFEAADVKTVTRLSAMVSTALDHLDAAEHSEHLIRE